MNYISEQLSKRIEEITLALTAELSVVDTPGELDSIRKVYEIMQEMPYYQQHPEDLFYVDLNDELGRKSVIAILRGKKAKSNKTVVMIGHTDTVGISDYGNLAQYANKPYELMEKLKDVQLTPAAKRDLESGEYLFGRGIFDMKAGDAVIMGIMEEIAKDIDNFEGNLIFAAVCDEESNSGGMFAAVPKLAELMDKEGFEYLALLDTDYMTAEFECAFGAAQGACAEVGAKMPFCFFQHVLLPFPFACAVVNGAAACAKAGGRCVLPCFSNAGGRLGQHARSGTCWGAHYFGRFHSAAIALPRRAGHNAGDLAKLPCGKACQRG